jgi:hypothetical protein
MKYGMNQHKVGVRGINSGREDRVETNSSEPATAQAAEPVCSEPEQKSQEMRAGKRRHAMPDDPGLR